MTRRSLDRRRPAGRLARPARGLCAQAAAYTLLEMLLSTAIVAVLLMGVAGAMFVAQRGMAASTDAAERSSDQARALQMIQTDVSLATAFTERTDRAITITVPDRTGDGQPETIRYAWSGTAGAPLTRQFNGGPVAVLLRDVRQFQFTYLLKTLQP